MLPSLFIPPILLYIGKGTLLRWMLFRNVSLVTTSFQARLYIGVQVKAFIGVSLVLDVITNTSVPNCVSCSFITYVSLNEYVMYFLVIFGA